MDRAWASVLALTLAAGGLGYWYAGTGEDAPVPLVPEVAEQPATSPARPVASAPAPGATGAPQPAASEPSRLPIQPASGPSKGPGQPKAWSAEPPVQVIREIATGDVVRYGRAPRTGAAMEQPLMFRLDANDPAYDPQVEARQLFNAFESELNGAGRLTQATWDTVSARHADAKQQMLNRSVELVEEGYGDESEALLVEWGLLEAHYEGQVE